MKMNKKKLALKIGFVGVLATSICFMRIIIKAASTPNYQVIADFNAFGEAIFEFYMMLFFFPFMVYYSWHSLNEVTV